MSAGPPPNVPGSNHGMSCTDELMVGHSNLQGVTCWQEISFLANRLDACWTVRSNPPEGHASQPFQYWI